MGISAHYYLYCDLCYLDTGSSRPSLGEAWSYAQNSGWSTNQEHGAAVCDQCYDPDKIYHFQYSNVYCVLCLSGEHVPVVCNKRP